MGAFTGLNSYFNGKLCDYAIKYGYDESNIVILEGDEDKLKKNHLATYNNLLSCGHHSDNRSFMRYGQDLVASWIFEDYFLSELKESGLNINLYGADRNRMILPSQKTSTTSDYILTLPSGEQIKIELVNDYTGFWDRTHTLHLRDDKYIKLKNNGSLMLAISVNEASQKFAIFDFRKDIPAKFIPKHRPFGYKAAYELSIPTSMLKTLSIDAIKNDLESLS